MCVCVCVCELMVFYHLSNMLTMRVANRCAAICEVKKITQDALDCWHIMTGGFQAYPYRIFS